MYMDRIKFCKYAYRLFCRLGISGSIKVDNVDSIEEVTFNVLTRSYNTSLHIAVDFEELTQLRSIYDRCNSWSKEVKAIYMLRPGKRRSNSDAALTASKPHMCDLEALLEQEQALGVTFYEEHQRLVAYVASVKKYEHDFEVFSKSMTFCFSKIND